MVLSLLLFPLLLPLLFSASLILANASAMVPRRPRGKTRTRLEAGVMVAGAEIGKRVGEDRSDGSILSLLLLFPLLPLLALAALT